MHPPTPRTEPSGKEKWSEPGGWTERPLGGSPPLTRAAGSLQGQVPVDVDASSRHVRVHRTGRTAAAFFLHRQLPRLRTPAALRDAHAALGPPTLTSRAPAPHLCVCPCRAPGPGASSGARAEAPCGAANLPAPWAGAVQRLLYFSLGLREASRARRETGAVGGCPRVVRVSALSQDIEQCGSSKSPFHPAMKK